jgi:hypothetical protein
VFFSSRFRNYPLTQPFLWLLLGLTLAGCNRNDIQVYRVAKEPAPATVAAQPVPAGWEQAPLGEMRAASYHVKSSNGKVADVSVIPLPGMAGRDLDNVNRWRGQVGQPPVTEAELSKLAQPIEIAGQSAQLYEQTGPNAESGATNRILAVILRNEGTAWFFKMTGDDELVADQKPAFIEYLKSFKFPSASSGVAETELPASHPLIARARTDLPPSREPLGAPGSSSPADSALSGQDKPEWQVPAGWQEVPAGQFLVDKFLITGPDKAQAAVNVSMSAGEGGGTIGNVNRWRKQLGLNDLSESDVNKLVTSVDIPGGKAIFVNMAGTDGRTGEKTSLVAAIVPREQRTWFYKLMGPEQLVGQNKESFTKFVQTAKYPQ